MVSDYRFQNLYLNLGIYLSQSLVIALNNRLQPHINMDRQPDWWTYFLQCVRSARRNSRMDGKLFIHTPHYHRAGVSVPTNHPQPPTSNLRTLYPTAYSASVHANQAQWRPSGANTSTTLSDAFGTCPPTTAPVYSSNVKVTVARYAPTPRLSIAFPTLMRISFALYP
jgi:hypothetical protein